MTWREVLAPYLKFFLNLFFWTWLGLAVVGVQLGGISEKEFRDVVSGRAYVVEELKAVAEAKKSWKIEKGGEIPQVQAKKQDPRVKAIETYLKRLNSPLWTKAQKFVEVSEKYDLPWWLLPSICVAESGCGKNVHRRYNPFGWGRVEFSSWDEAIETVGRRLRKGYFDRGCGDLNCIWKVYNGGYENWMKNVLASKVVLEELYLKFGGK